MKILIVTGSYPPETGGIAELMKGFADGLSCEGIRVSILTSVFGAATFSTERVAVHDFHLPSRGFIRRVLTCRNAVRQFAETNSFDRVAVSSWSPFAIGLPPPHSAWGAPLDVFCHGLDLLEPARSMRYRAILKRTLRSAATVIANSNFTASVARELGTPTKNILVLNPGIDVARFSPGERPADIAGRLGVRPHDRVLLSVGRLIPRKGFDLTLEALPRVLEAHPFTLYIIAGDGPDRGRLEQLASTLNVAGHVRFVGSVPTHELPLYYRLADIFVMPSRYIREQGDVEGFGIVFLEAGLSEVPSVGGNSGGIPDAIVHSETGLLVNPTDPVDCADRICDLLDDRDLLVRMGTTARSRVIAEFSWRRIVSKYLDRVT